MADIIYLDDRRPHITGYAECKGPRGERNEKCGHRWIAVVPEGLLDKLECPECGQMTGQITYLTPFL
jgi:hypothetical protein